MHGLPKELVSDNGPQLASREFRDFLKRNGVKHTLVPAYHPASNGAAERSVQIVKSTLKKHLEAEKAGREDKLSIQQRLDDFLLHYRITPQSTTGRAPAELFLKHELRNRFSLLRPDLGTKVSEKQRRQAKAHDPVKIQNREFHENEIGVRNYFGSDKWVKGRVVKRLGKYWYIVQVGNRCRKVHIEQLVSRSADEVQPTIVPRESEAQSNIRPPELREVPPIVSQNVLPDMAQGVPAEEPPDTQTEVPSSSVVGPEPVLRRSSRISTKPKRLIEEV